MDHKINFDPSWAKINRIKNGFLVEVSNNSITDTWSFGTIEECLEFLSTARFWHSS